jgi:hypothetical protein
MFNSFLCFQLRVSEESKKTHLFLVESFILSVICYQQIFLGLFKLCPDISEGIMMPWLFWSSCPSHLTDCFSLDFEIVRHTTSTLLKTSGLRPPDYNNSLVSLNLISELSTIV